MRSRPTLARTDSIMAILSHYPDSDRIEVSVSATGQGRHLRWLYSDDDLKPKESREPTPFPSAGSDGEVDADGDSQMGDDSSEADSDSDTETVTGRLCTPQPLGPYNPGSVVLTPRKDGRRRLQREARLNDWWNASDGIESRVTLRRDVSVEPDVGGSYKPRVGPRSGHVQNRLDARARYGYTGSTSSISEADEDEMADDDDDTRSVVSSAATVYAEADDVRPTLRKPELPIIRHDVPEGARPKRKRVTFRKPTSKDDGKVVRAGPAGPGAGWVRDGSLAPSDVAYDLYHLGHMKSLPKVSPKMYDRLRDMSSGSLARTDTESAAADEEERAPTPQPVPAKTPPRRSERLRELGKGKQK